MSRHIHCNDVELRYFSRLSGRALILCLVAFASAMLNSISRLGETRPEQEWSNGTEFSGYSDFPEKRVHSKRIPKFSKTFPGIFTVPFSFGPEISEFLAEWKAPTEFTYKFENSLLIKSTARTPHTRLISRPH